MAIDAGASNSRPATVAITASSSASTTADIAVTAAPPAPAACDTAPLAAAVAAILGAKGARVGISLAELGGTLPLKWSLNGSAVFDAASTYKLTALMIEAEGIAAGSIDPNGLVHFEAADYEAGVFDDYSVGVGFSRNVLAYRAGHYSDNTAGHMLVRDIGGGTALNAWAAALGATGSSFFDTNATTADDLTALWVAEAGGKLGGSAA